ncbi:unnamed protein product [Cylindrotheca closterium]|uniref:Plastid lipid-associated protein/fibrillin conserved domain-containing protein n=1 Tax=Cylindrotheca closterium TaxID=2856 RepID=A0AAD2FQY5_9STRA|nr:unnamed protein product [Cylindrotheca closterium]
MARVDNVIATLLAFVFVVHGLSSSSTEHASRRDWLRQTTGAAGICLFGSISSPSSATASDSVQELPDVLRKISLAPLGKPQTFENKSLNLPLEELASRLTRDLTVGANGSGGYFLTGDLSTDIFKDDCVFADPTNNVASLSRYQNALRILFDPASSQIQLLSPLTIHTETQPKTISGRIRSRGYIQLPWRPYVSAYESDIVYTIDDETGLIARQDQVWDSKSPSKALRESFTPSSFLFNQPPPKSSLKPSPAEPKAASQLFDYINGRRPNEYTFQETKEIEGLIQEVVDTGKTKSEITNKPEFQRGLLPGRWILAYLQPGPNGVGIDRRIPFPDFDFNDNYQVFSESSSQQQPQQVTNIGQVLGPWIDVKVSGMLQEEDPSSTRIPKRFQANINGGKLCVHAGSNTEGACVGLPIKGEGIFDSLYLGERLRIGQNINGGGARVVQIRLD